MFLIPSALKFQIRRTDWCQSRRYKDQSFLKTIQFLLCRCTLIQRSTMALSCRYQWVWTPNVFNLLRGSQPKANKSRQKAPSEDMTYCGLYLDITTEWTCAALRGLGWNHVNLTRKREIPNTKQLEGRWWWWLAESKVFFSLLLRRLSLAHSLARSQAEYEDEWIVECLPDPIFRSSFSMLFNDFIVPFLRRARSEFLSTLVILDARRSLNIQTERRRVDSIQFREGKKL